MSEVHTPESMSFPQKRESISRNPRLGGRILRMCAFVGSLIAGVLAGEKLARAQETTAFGPEINDSMGPQRAQLIPGVLEERLRMIFSATTEVLGQDLYAAEFQLEIAESGSLILRRMGSVQLLPISSPLLFGGEDFFGVEFNRADGRRNTIQVPGIDEATGWPNAGFDMNGEARWPFDCPDSEAIMNYIHPSQNPNELVVLARMGDRANPDAWRVNINESNYCTAIQDSIAAAEAAGQTPFEAGLLVERESTGARETSIAVDETFEAITRETVDSQATYLYWIDPATGERRHLERNPDGTWTEEDPQTIPGTSETGFGSTHSASSVIKRIIGGRVFHLYVFNTVDPALYGGSVILKVLALEETPPGSAILTEVPIEMASDDAEVDDDADGRSNLDEGDAGCRWRSNPGGVDVSGPVGIDIADGKEDACQANCEEGGWPGVDPAGETNPSGLRVCESELGYANAFTDEDGSTFHSNMDVALAADGAIALQPGQTIRYIHSKDPRVAEAPSRDIRFPDGNSLQVNIHDTSHLDGSPATATLQYRPYEGYDPLAAPVTVTFDGPTGGVMDYPEAIGAELGLEGSDVEVTAGSENLPVPCPPNCPLPDAGTPDAGEPDAGAPDAEIPDAGASEPDAEIPIPDADVPDSFLPDAGILDEETPDAIAPDATPPDAQTPDAETPDAGTQDAMPPPPDANQPDASQPDAKTSDTETTADSGMRADAGPGRVDTGDDNANPPPGCGCKVPGSSNENSNPFNGAPLILTAVGLAGLTRRRRKN